MNNSDGSGAAAAAAALGGTSIIIWLAILAFFVFIWWRIFTKAGFPGPMALLMFIPCVNFIMMLYFAFTEWPIERQVRGGGNPSGPYAGGPPTF